MTLQIQGLLYRALNPIYAQDPLSGLGAERFGGRLNEIGVPTLYTSTAPETAIRESNQVGTLQPTTLVAYQADIQPVFDGTEEKALRAFGMTPEILSESGWRNLSRNGPAPTQSFANRLIAEGFAGIQLPSFARGAPRNAINVVLWRWGDTMPTKLTVIDDQDRLRLKSGA